MDQEEENKGKKEDNLTEITDEKVMKDIGHPPMMVSLIIIIITAI